MKLNFSQIKSNLNSILQSYKRFPVTALSFAVLATLIIWLNEATDVLASDTIQLIVRINMAVALFGILSLNVSLFNETDSKPTLQRQLISHSLAALLTIGYFFFYLKDFNSVTMMRFTSIVLTLIIVVFFIQRIRIPSHYETYVLRIFNGAFTTGIYAAVLYAGISIIMFTISTLFSVNIAGKFYFYSFILVSLIFAVALFLSKLPQYNDDTSGFRYPDSLKILLTFIVIPLISVYTFILYAYFARILFSGEWPQGLVSHLVLWYSTVSVGVIFLLTPVQAQHQISSLFRKWFPILIIPVLGMMFASIGLRIRQYGFTENRYLIVILGLWVTSVMIYLAVKKSQRNILIPISLAIVVFISMFGPMSSFAVSIRSQNNRLENVLAQYEMIENGDIQPNPEIPLAAKKEISSILGYFDTMHTLNDVAILPNDFTLVNMPSVFGFEYVPEYDIPMNNYFYYHSDISKSGLRISDYDYYFSVNPWITNPEPIDGFEVDLRLEEARILVARDDENVLDIDLEPIVQELYASFSNNALQEKDIEIPLSKMTFTGEQNGVKYLIAFVHIAGYSDFENKPVIDNLDIIMLIGIQ